MHSVPAFYLRTALELPESAYRWVWSQKRSETLLLRFRVSTWNELHRGALEPDTAHTVVGKRNER